MRNKSFFDLTMLALFYIFLIFVALVPVGHWVFLTVNEEFFVFASFFIFIDLFGLTFVYLVSDSTAPTQQRIAARFRAVLEAELAIHANLHASYLQLFQLVNVTSSVRKQFYEDLYNLIKQRRMDIKLFAIQSKIVTYRILYLYELDLDRFGSYLASDDQMQDLRHSLEQLPVGVGVATSEVHSSNLNRTLQLLNSLES